MLGALNSLRRDLEHPGKAKRNRQTDCDKQDNQADDPVRNVEDWKDLRDSCDSAQPATMYATATL